VKYKLDLLGVKQVRREEGGTERMGDFIFICGDGNGAGILCIRELYLQLGGRTSLV
jgi:hypothetical protein